MQGRLWVRFDWGLHGAAGWAALTYERYADQCAKVNPPGFRGTARIASPIIPLSIQSQGTTL